MNTIEQVTGDGCWRYHAMPSRFSLDLSDLHAILVLAEIHISVSSSLHTSNPEFRRSALPLDLSPLQIAHAQ